MPVCQDVSSEELSRQVGYNLLKNRHGDMYLVRILVTPALIDGASIGAVGRLSRLPGAAVGSFGQAEQGRHAGDQFTRKYLPAAPAGDTPS